MIRLFLFSFLLFSNLATAGPYDHLIHSLGSLTCYLEQESEKVPADSLIPFTKRDSDHLLEKVSQAISDLPSEQDHFEHAFALIETGERLKNEGEIQQSKSLFKEASKAIKKILKKAVSRENLGTASAVYCKVTTRSSLHLENNPYISSEAKAKIRPYLISQNHELRPALDRIFEKTRVTTDLESVKKAGFDILAKGPRSQIYVGSHPKLPNHLLKFHLDNNLIKKRGRESWEWLVKRCIGAAKIHEIIKNRKIKHFTCATKNIYCFPANPSPPRTNRYTRHLACLLVTDMHLVDKKKNLHAWKHYITKEHLQELYAIMSRAKGSSYRPDNINYTREGTFAFIDTEYPDASPDYRSIRRHLSDEMRDYWDRLVKRGG